MPTLDYFLSSDLMEPADAADHYTEQLVRLPNLSIYYEPVRIDTVTVSREELGIRPDACVFWCGQSIYKYLPQFDHVFARIALQVRNSQFIFIRYSGGQPINKLFEDRLKRAFAAMGLKAADHCVYVTHLSLNKFVAVFGLCDIFLDSIGWSGGNTTLESLQHDLPIVTLTGSLMRGRHSAAILQMLGISETIVESVDDYISVAASLAQDHTRRMAIKAKIASSKHKIYRDHSCISALEEFIERVARGPRL